MFTKNQPNAAKLLSSLRSTGYDSYAAVADIIDNCIDAGARKINVSVDTASKNPVITIIDDGVGMSLDVLDEALKLGSATQKDEISDLGKYGMGLCTASISIGRRLEVITKQAEGACLYSVQDLDDVVEQNDFVKELREATPAEEKIFSNLVGGNHGTVVILSKVDRLTSNVSSFSGKLSKELGRIFRKFIDSGVEISVNQKDVISTDPLMLESDGTSVYSDEEYEIPGTAGKQSFRVKIALLPDANDEMQTELKMNQRTQGFYILRNNREIANGVSLGVFSKHNALNRLRMELSFTSDLDMEMGVNFSKDGVTPNQAVTDFLKQEISGQVASIRKITEKAKVVDKSSEINHAESAAVIAKKAKLLIAPTAPRKPSGAKPDGDEKTKTGTRVSSPRPRTTEPMSGPNARFETLSMGAAGALYDCYQEGKIVVVQWNVDHPFYMKIILANRDRKQVTAGIDYLVYALASAELKNLDDDNTVLLNTIKTVMSANLRALLT